MPDLLPHDQGRRTSATVLFVRIMAVILLCAAVYMMRVSTMSFETLKAVAGSSIPAGYLDRFTPALYSKIVMALRALGFVLVLVGLALLRFAEAIRRVLKRWLQEDLAGQWRALGGALGSLKSDPLHLAALAAILLWAVWLRYTFLGEPIRKDEAYSFLYYGSRPAFVGMAYYTANNHLLNTLLMHISWLVFGTSEWAVRLPVFVTGLLMVPVTYTAVRLSRGKNAGILAMALVSASSPLIEFSFNARGYGLGAMFLMVMVCMIEVTRRGHRSTWPYIAIAAALALYSVPTMLYGVGGAFCYMLLTDSNRRRTIYAMLLAGALTLACYTPPVVTVGLAGIVRNKWAAPVPREQWMPLSIQEWRSLWVYWNLDLPLVTSGLIVAGLLLVFMSRKTLLRSPAGVLLLTLLLAACLLPVQGVVPPRRTWLFLLPLFLATAGVGLDAMLRKAGSRYSLAAVLLAAGMSGWMGAEVLRFKSLRHSGPEAFGGRSAEAVAMGMQERLAQGGQFICADVFDSSIDFYLLKHKIRYSPKPNGELLIVTPPGLTAERTLRLASIPQDGVASLRLIARYPEADVYAGQRTASLVFRPRGGVDEGIFTTIVE